MKTSHLLRVLGLTFAVAVLALTGIQLQGAEAENPQVVICPNVGQPCNNDADCGAPINPDCFCNTANHQCRSRFLVANQ